MRRRHSCLRPESRQRLIHTHLPPASLLAAEDFQQEAEKRPPVTVNLIADNGGPY